jgi:hypothetical protein
MLAESHGGAPNKRVNLISNGSGRASSGPTAHRLRAMRWDDTSQAQRRSEKGGARP